jgi:hypothetical protein
LNVALEAGSGSLQSDKTNTCTNARAVSGISWA